MTNVIHFPRRPDQRFIEIDGGVIRSATKTTRVGTVDLPYEAGTFRFFVTLIEADGSEICLWEGGDYEEAIWEAETFRRPLSITAEVLDRVAGWPQ